MNTYLLSHYGPDGLEHATLDQAPPGPLEVAVRLEAIAINPLDWKIRNGWLAELIPLPLPAVIGSEASGTVVSVGAEVTGFAVGDRVAGFIDSGAFAEYAVTRATRLLRVPAGLSLEQAAALPTAAETATRIYALLRPEPGSTVVVNGAAGAVGSMITQLLVRDGHSVIGTASLGNHDYVRGLGATPIGYGSALVDDLRRLAPAGIHAAYDTTGHGLVERVTEVIPANRIVTIADFAAAAQGAIVAGGDPTQLTITAAVREVFDAAARGELHVAIAAEYDFDALPDALAYSERGHLHGKIIVRGKVGDSAVA